MSLLEVVCSLLRCGHGTYRVLVHYWWLVGSLCSLGHLMERSQHIAIFLFRTLSRLPAFSLFGTDILLLWKGAAVPFYKVAIPVLSAVCGQPDHGAGPQL